MNPESQKRPTAPRAWWVALALGIALAVAAVTTLWHLRRDSIDAQTREIRLLLLALTDALDRGLQGAEEGLHAMRIELRDGHLPATDAGASRALRTRAALMPLVRTIWLVERHGQALAASDTTTAPEMASFVPPLDRLTDEAIAVSQPFMDMNTQESLVALAIRVAEGPGIAGGWIFAAIPAEALRGAFSVASPAADARLAVYRGDGVRLAGSAVAVPERDEVSTALRLASMPRMELRGFSDGRERLVGVHRLPRYGLLVMLTRDLDAVLTSWMEVVRFTAIGILLLLVITAVSIGYVQRADRRSAEAERELQVERARASKLQSLGALAGGIAHDFNNVLGAIVGFGEMASDSAPPGSDQARHLDKMLQAAARGKSFVERILTFSHGGARTSTVFELETVLEEVLTLLSASLRPGVVLERRLDAHGGRLRGDPTQAFEAIMNLCTNAIQAMPTGGTVGVGLDRLHVGAPRVLSHTQLTAGDYLVLTVSDQGTGITPEVMERLFEPFFTTRSAQSGTGLGLAVVHGVVAEFGGAIDVQSTPGQGARFTLYFPECAEALEPESSR